MENLLKNIACTPPEPRNKTLSDEGVKASSEDRTLNDILEENYDSNEEPTNDEEHKRCSSNTNEDNTNEDNLSATVSPEPEYLNQALGLALGL